MRMIYRHKKRGTEYVLLGYGKMQAEDWFDAYPTGDADCVDMREVVIYRSVTDPTEIWVRPREEFEERFEADRARRPVVADEEVTRAANSFWGKEGRETRSDNPKIPY